MKKIFERFKDLLTKDFLITVFGQVIVLVITFLVNKILANYVSTEEFGVYNIARRLSDVVSYIALLAMGIAVPKYLAEYKARNDEGGVHLFWMASLFLVLSASVIIAVVVYFARVPIMKGMFGVYGYEKYALAAIIYAVGCAFSTLIYSYCRGVGYYYKYSFIQIGIQIVFFVVVLIFNSNSFYILIVTGLVYLLASLAVVIFYIWKKRKLVRQFKTPKLYVKPVKELLIYGLPRVPGEFVLFAYNLVPLVIISNKFDLTQSAYFSASLSVNTTITAAFGFIGVMLLPAVSSAIATHKFKSVDKNISLLCLLYVLISGLGIIFVYFCGEWLIKLLYSEEYISATLILIITSVAILPRAIFLLLRNPIDAVSRFPYNTINLAISFAITCIGMLFANSIQLCAWVYVIGYCVLAVLSFVTWMFCRRRVIKSIKSAAEESEVQLVGIDEIENDSEEVIDSTVEIDGKDITDSNVESDNRNENSD